MKVAQPLRCRIIHWKESVRRDGTSLYDLDSFKPVLTTLWKQQVITYTSESGLTTLLRHPIEPYVTLDSYPEVISRVEAIELRRRLGSKPCPSNHWNDGNDICADCGANLQE